MRLALSQAGARDHPPIEHVRALRRRPPAGRRRSSSRSCTRAGRRGCQHEPSSTTASSGTPTARASRATAPTTAPAAATAWPTSTWPRPSRSSGSRTGPSRSPRWAAASSSTTTSTSATPRRPTAGRRRWPSATRWPTPSRSSSATRATATWPRSAWPRSCSAAQMGMPITVIFINNAIYGMTGGQMAPTTLMGQKTTTTPDGPRPVHRRADEGGRDRSASSTGRSTSSGWRCSTTSSAIGREKAIKKAIQLQVENRGFSFVEVLAECPTHLQDDPARGREVGQGEDGCRSSRSG